MTPKFMDSLAKRAAEEAERKEAERKEAEEAERLWRERVKAAAVKVATEFLDEKFDIDANPDEVIDVRVNDGAYPGEKAIESVIFTMHEHPLVILQVDTIPASSSQAADVRKPAGWHVSAYIDGKTSVFTSASELFAALQTVFENDRS